MSSIGEKRKCATEDTRTITSCRIIVSKNIVQGGTKSRQNYIPRNVDPKGDGAQDGITGAEPGGEDISGADRFAEEEAGRIRSNLVKERSGTKVIPGDRLDKGRHQERKYRDQTHPSRRKGQRNLDQTRTDSSKRAIKATEET